MSLSPVDRSVLLRVSEKEVAAVRATLNLGDEDSIRRDVDMVLEWYSKQQHLPRVPLDGDYVERMLINRKGSVEQTKQKIELMFTLRTLVPEMASPRDILHPDIQNQFKVMAYAAMPNLNHDLTRVQIYKFTENSEDFVIADTFKYIFMTFEYRLKYDYALGDRIIFDYQNATFAHITKFNPIAIKKAELLLQAYGNRIFGFHYINAPAFIGTVLNIVKGALSTKLGDRITVHPSYEDLHKVISKEVLPVEYGGEEDALDMHAQKWKQELSKEEIRQYLIKQESLKSDESLRLEGRPSDETLGIPGSFKIINVD